MNKTVFYDANKVKWIIEKDPRIGLWWGHVEGDSEILSGEIGDSIEQVFKKLVDDGYMSEE